MFDWRKILLSPDDPLDYTIKVLHEGGCRIALVSNEHGRLLGTITDGDIRRALINKLTMKSAVSLVMNSNPVTVDDKVNHKDILTLMFSFKHLGSYRSTNLAVSEQMKQEIQWDSRLMVSISGTGKEMQATDSAVFCGAMWLPHKTVLKVYRK